MLDRLESISRLLCIGLGALLFLQLVNAILHGDPLGRATIPGLPTLPAIAPAGAPPASVKTNSAPLAKTTGSIETNSAPLAKTTGSIETNSAPVAKTAGPHSGLPQPMRGKKADLPPTVQARVDRVVESEILGPFIRPMPMALLGIAGDDAFLRAPDGQTGMVKEGDALGAIKLLRIGINRVLVEENGEKKELTLFAGMGGETLLPPETNSTFKTNAPVKKKETH
jgi:hypothetical protein